MTINTRNHSGWLSSFLLLTLCFALLTVVLSSYIRLVESGAGCEPWPSCYGQYHQNVSSNGINVLMGEGEPSPLQLEKIAHRLIASILGALILVLYGLSWKRKYRQQLGRKIPTLLMILTIMLALIGPIHPSNPVPILTLDNFIGGLAIVGFIFYLYRQCGAIEKPVNYTAIIPFIKGGILLIVLQIIWGGWTSANFAGASCDKVFRCNSIEQSNPTTNETLNPFQSLELAYDVESDQSKVVFNSTMEIIQFFHHVLAVFTIIYFIIIVLKLSNSKVASEQALHNSCLIVLSFLVLQLVLGMGTIVFQLHIAIVVAHNLLAALLVIFLTSLKLKLPMRSS